MPTWKIRDLTIANQVVIAPLAGISNQAFRSIAKQFNAGLVYSEMISDKAIVHGNIRTIEMCQINADEHPVALQLFGEEIDSMVKAAIYMDLHTDCDIIDINMGCPVPKVVKGSGGASLMKTPELAADLIYHITRNVHKPVTAKIRTGWDNSSINAVEMAVGLEKAGASAIAIHGRTRSAMYGGSVNIEEIARVKAALTIPLIANGDITSLEKAREMILLTNADALMIGRGILGNPWLIEELVNGLDGNSAPLEISLHHKFEIARRHAEKLIVVKGEKVAIKQMRGHFCWYITGLTRSHSVKTLISQMTTYEQFDRIVRDYEIALQTNDWAFLEKAD